MNMIFYGDSASPALAEATVQSLREKGFEAEARDCSVHVEESCCYAAQAFRPLAWARRSGGGVQSKDIVAEAKETLLWEEGGGG